MHKKILISYGFPNFYVARIFLEKKESEDLTELISILDFRFIHKFTKNI